MNEKSEIMCPYCSKNLSKALIQVRIDALAEVEKMIDKAIGLNEQMYDRKICTLVERNYVFHSLSNVIEELQKLKGEGK